MIRPAILFLAAVVALPLSAQTPTAQAPAKAYAQYLVDTTASRHPELLQLDEAAIAEHPRTSTRFDLFDKDWQFRQALVDTSRAAPDATQA